ncbi:histidine phosphatase superfamily [Bombardia bombarda]|uniref:Histidine phosphatase superfamily n=1 Tax=Bombardia bombarda TaxID=252184 RepID=A0AA39WHD0_9PEZI|nr:histidine phosphatase superfamily [Bombardia bombarda]
MPPTIILVRHAQALHNVNQDYSIPDPELSELGRNQCNDLKANLLGKIPGEFDVGLIVVSAMRRTIETALLAFGPLIEQGIPIQAHAGWQENSANLCDTGSPIPALVAEFPQVDFSHVDPVFPDKTSPAGAKYAYTKQAILARGQSSLADLYARPEKVIIVVSHSSFLRQSVTGWWFFNADYRVFDFEEKKSEDEPFRLKQWDQTLNGGLGWSWKEQVELGSGLPEDLSLRAVLYFSKCGHDEHTCNENRTILPIWHSFIISNSTSLCFFWPKFAFAQPGSWLYHVVLYKKHGHHYEHITGWAEVDDGIWVTDRDGHTDENISKYLCFQNVR